MIITQLFFLKIRVFFFQNLIDWPEKDPGRAGSCRLHRLEEPRLKKIPSSPANWHSVPVAVDFGERNVLRCSDGGMGAKTRVAQEFLETFGTDSGLHLDQLFFIPKVPKLL